MKNLVKPTGTKEARFTKRKNLWHWWYVRRNGYTDQKMLNLKISWNVTSKNFETLWKIKPRNTGNKRRRILALRPRKYFQKTHNQKFFSPKRGHQENTAHRINWSGFTCAHRDWSSKHVPCMGLHRPFAYMLWFCSWLFL